MNDFLIQLDAESKGFLFRNGPLVELLITTLKVDPQERQPVRLAWRKLQEFAPLPEAKIEFKTKDLNSLRERVAAAFPRSDELTKPAPTSKPRPPRVPTVNGTDETFANEPFRSLEAIISIVEGSSALATLVEPSTRRYELKEPAVLQESAINSDVESMKESTALSSVGATALYCEVRGFRNRAKGTRWEAVALATAPEGGSLPAPGAQVEILGLVGVALVRGGNHVLIVVADGYEPTARALSISLRALLDNMGSEAGRCKYLELESLDFGDRRTLRDIWSYSMRQPQ
mmetsp:Transcript_20497/g.48506  ORF Transcript_20497/g.48506 Transcript_20497/m.48506 type:complete len:288 (+) Transcript_20497:172-1035(+)